MRKTPELPDFSSLNDEQVDFEAERFQELSNLARQGDAEAAAAVVAHYFDYWLRAARSIVGTDGSAHEACDLVQDASLRLIELWHRGEGPESNTRSYVTSMMRNSYLNRLRSPRSRELAIDDLGTSAVLQSEDDYRHIELSREAESVRRAFACLSDDHQFVLQAVMVEGRKPAELVEHLSRPAPAISSLLLRAKQALRRSLLLDHLARGGDTCAANAKSLPKRVHDSVEAHKPHDAGLAHVRECAACRQNWSRFGQVTSALGLLPLFTVAMLSQKAGGAGAAVVGEQASLSEPTVDGSSAGGSSATSTGGAGGAGGAGASGASGAAAGATSAAGAAGTAGGSAAAGVAAAAAVTAGAATAGSRIAALLASNVSLVAGIATVAVSGVVILASVLNGHTSERSVSNDDAGNSQRLERVDFEEGGHTLVTTLPANELGAELNVGLDIAADDSLRGISGEFGVAGVENWQLQELRLTLSPGTSYTGVSGGMTCEGGASEIVCTPDSAGQRLGGVGFTIDDEVGSGSFALEIVASAEGEVFTGSATGNW